MWQGDLITNRSKPLGIKVSNYREKSMQWLMRMSYSPIPGKKKSIKLLYGSVAIKTSRTWNSLAAGSSNSLVFAPLSDELDLFWGLRQQWLAQGPPVDFMWKSGELRLPLPILRAGDPLIFWAHVCYQTDRIPPSNQDIAEINACACITWKWCHGDVLVWNWFYHRV